MALGKLERVDNTERTFGASAWYWRVRVQLADKDEYWLVTESEASQFAERGAKDTGNSAAMKSGKVGFVVNKDPTPGAAPAYYELTITVEDGSIMFWSLTERELARVQERARKNPEDVAAVVVAEKQLLARFWAWLQKMLK